MRCVPPFPLAEMHFGSNASNNSLLYPLVRYVLDSAKLVMELLLVQGFIPLCLASLVITPNKNNSLLEFH